MHGTTPADIPVDGNSPPRRLQYPSDEARALLGGIPESTFRKLTSTGQLKAKKVGGRVFVKHEELTAFIERQPDVCDADVPAA